MTCVARSGPSWARGLFPSRGFQTKLGTNPWPPRTGREHLLGADWMPGTGPRAAGPRTGSCGGLPEGPWQRVEIHKLRQGENLILGFSIGGGIDQDPAQNPFSEDKTDKGIYVTRVSEGGPAEVAGLQIGDKIMQVNGWDMTMVTHDQARKRLTKRNEEVVRLLVTRQGLQKAVQQSMLA
ncbi:tax1-binding protein 3 isoform X1 [Antechinus flavipes]|uniref:tax1-binding protein 3 isoform X1 n=1 Tax=Antechinus flavipes TaxID=38775 RepID=UPI0022361543|nr:tax1-binding protein 3 isoform X1 [Antechinus flavipes]